MVGQRPDAALSRHHDPRYVMINFKTLIFTTIGVKPIEYCIRSMPYSGINLIFSGNFKHSLNSTRCSKEEGIKQDRCAWTAKRKELQTIVITTEDFEASQDFKLQLSSQTNSTGALIERA